MELTELESRITHKRIGRPEVPAATDFKGSRYGAQVFNYVERTSELHIGSPKPVTA
jgi:hypothetical protein